MSEEMRKLFRSKFAVKTGAAGMVGGKAATRYFEED